MSITPERRTALIGQYATAQADTGSPDDTVRRQNPIGKIPVLILDDGSALYDSRVILEYLERARCARQVNAVHFAAEYLTLRC